jgi:hypothetical protein
MMGFHLWDLVIKSSYHEPECRKVHYSCCTQNNVCLIKAWSVSQKRKEKINAILNSKLNIILLLRYVPVNMSYMPMQVS